MNNASRSSEFPIPVVSETGTIHPRSIRGTFRRFKSVILLIALAIFFLLPWFPWERSTAANQAVLFDLNEHRFYLFGLVVHAQEIFWLAILLFLAAVLLFFSTTLLGRAFCGYFCFQTLWTDAFRFIEKVIQGDRVKRIRLQKQEWNLEKITRKLLTHGLWLLLAFMTGLTFSLYWSYAPDLVKAFFTGQAHIATYITTLILMITTYLAAGVMRDNICLHVCPYARFQSVMIDRDTLVPSYDVIRGESVNGRAKLIHENKTREQRQENQVGDCIDCGLCVQVCPTGIDIRDGMQYQCIQCGLCVDACDSIMTSKGWPKGLIRYASESGLSAPGAKRSVQSWLKLGGYGLAILAALGFLFYSIQQAKPVEVTLEQIRNPLFLTLSDGSLQNRYRLKVENKTQQKIIYTLSQSGLKDATIDTGEIQQVVIHPESSQRFMIKVRKLTQKDEDKQQPFNFLLKPAASSRLKQDGPVLTIPANFIQP